MAKAKKIFYCTACGYETSGWLGRCPNCQAWNSFEEQTVSSPDAASKGKAGVSQGWLTSLLEEDESAGAVQNLEDVDSSQAKHYPSGISEFDRVLGGGFVPGSLVLVGGDPGIGKSTLLLQACAATRADRSVLYICGEESPQQVKIRAERLGIIGSRIKVSTEVIFEKLAHIINQLKPSLCVVDSIQTIYSEQSSSAPGSVSQVRDVSAGFLRLAKSLGTTIILVGHVTKDGSLAGPRILEHMVDTVLYFEGDRFSSLRLIRAVKNRFGATNEIGLFEMEERGLIPVANASETLLESRPQAVAGSALSVIVEGTRPLIIEIQALLNPSAYPTAMRMAQGLDRNRVSMLMALLEKQLGMNLSNMDAFINVVSGLKADDPATDLALLAAITSSFRGTPLKDRLLLCGEVGLTGEIRPVTRLAERLAEADQLGFKTILLPGSAQRSAGKLKLKPETEIIFVDTIREALDICW